ncbi:hypothetical protein M427DRAFT_75006 [Gonapodya prolifera JEL478]|uniref:Uncharacterized protein n=1 Tax=Gonapodya prolifera (strain JEL478) TaxID=1344416 RepID=A0A138ZZ11_GONPJ|nr:hypothetical protein M427DRAFT_75006 [Gonapodya prolifera JEL478]|eukprot:KXS09752.1 hypothetical protein M427DRAFT_75006 [Gonapodya prolifera JEL478]
MATGQRATRVLQRGGDGSGGGGGGGDDGDDGGGGDVDGSGDASWTSSRLAAQPSASLDASLSQSTATFPSLSSASSSSLSLALALPASHPSPNATRYTSQSGPFALSSSTVEALIHADQNQHTFAKMCARSGSADSCEMPCTPWNASSESITGTAVVTTPNNDDEPKIHIASSSPWYSFMSPPSSASARANTIPSSSTALLNSSARTKEVFDDGTVLQWVWPHSSSSHPHSDQPDRPPNPTYPSPTPATPKHHSYATLDDCDSPDLMPRAPSVGQINRTVVALSRQSDMDSATDPQRAGKGNRTAILAALKPSSPSLLSLDPVPLIPPPTNPPNSPPTSPTSLRTNSTARRPAWGTGTPPRPLTIPLPSTLSSTSWPRLDALPAPASKPHPTTHSRGPSQTSYSRIPSAPLRRGSTTSTVSSSSASSSSASSTSAPRPPTASYAAGVGVRVKRTSVHPWDNPPPPPPKLRSRVPTPPDDPVDVSGVGFKVDCWLDPAVGQKRARVRRGSGSGAGGGGDGSECESGNSSGGEGGEGASGGGRTGSRAGRNGSVSGGEGGEGGRSGGGTGSGSSKGRSGSESDGGRGGARGMAVGTKDGKRGQRQQSQDAKGKKNAKNERRAQGGMRERTAQG